MDEPGKKNFQGGMNTLAPDFDLPPATVRDLRNCVLTANGLVKRRDGFSQATSGVTHSLWSDGDFAFYVSDNTLFNLKDTEGVLSRTVARLHMVPNARVSYARVGNDVYWSNGTDFERITNGTSVMPVPTPNPYPRITVTGGGSLRKGVYQICISNAIGDEESAPTWPVQVEVSEGSSIVISLPVTGFNRYIYMSTQNGDQMFLVGMAFSGQNTFVIPTMPIYGRRCTIEKLRSMPAGHIVRWSNGRLLVANDNILYYSEPYAPTLFNPLKNFIQFSERITMVLPTDFGMYIGADKTYWLAGEDINKAELISVMPHTVTEGTEWSVPNSNDVGWYGSRGLVRADQNGKATLQQDDSIAPDLAGSGAAIYREVDGMKYTIASLSNANASFAAAKSFMEAEVIRKE